MDWSFVKNAPFNLEVHLFLQTCPPPNPLHISSISLSAHTAYGNLHSFPIARKKTTSLRPAHATCSFLTPSTSPRACGSIAPSDRNPVHRNLRLRGSPETRASRPSGRHGRTDPPSPGRRSRALWWVTREALEHNEAFFLQQSSKAGGSRCSR